MVKYFISLFLSTELAIMNANPMYKKTTLSFRITVQQSRNVYTQSNILHNKMTMQPINYTYVLLRVRCRKRLTHILFFFQEKLSEVHCDKANYNGMFCACA